MDPARICIIRHGETDWNLEKRIQGHIDVSLNAVGRAQAAAVAAGLLSQDFAAIYSSDLSRAWQTAKAAGRRLGLEVQAAPGLRERHYGLMQGLTAEEGAARHPDAYLRYRARDPDYRFGTGESLRAFADRVVATIEALAWQYPGASLLLVAHGGLLDICYRRATGRDLISPRDFVIPNAALNWFEVGATGWRLLSWADRTHLERALEESVE